MLKFVRIISVFLILFPSLVLAKELVRVNTTSPELTLTNLNSQIETLEVLLRNNPSRTSFRSALFDLISTRSQFIGSYSDLDTLSKLSSEFSDDEEGLLVKARYYSTIHEFKKTLEILDGLKNSSPEIQSLKIKSKLALREDLENIKNEQLEVLQKNKKYSNYLLLAEIESELGNFTKADEHFEESFKSYNDSSPLPLAYMFFRRGVMWSEKADNKELGLLYYNEATHYFPQFVNAQVHRAEIVSSNGDINGAITSLLDVSSSQDPEPKGLLAELYLVSGQEAKVKDLVKSASDSYSQLLEKYPLAFADHASEFYAGAGNNYKLSLELANKNLENRKTERSYIVAIESAIKANSSKDLCKFLKESEALIPAYTTLQNLIKENQSKCINNT